MFLCALISAGKSIDMNKRIAEYENDFYFEN